jgi:predicted PurR-regulated permease PerM
LVVARRGRFLRNLSRVVPPGRDAMTGELISAIHRQVQKYIVIKTLMSLANGLVVFVILTAFGVDFAAVHGFLAFLLNYIPNFGSFIAAAIRVLLTFVQFGSPWLALAVLVTTVGADTLLGSFLEPRLMGRQLDLSPLVVFFALVFWGWLWGVPGMVLAVPITGVMKIVCDNVPSLRFVGVLMGGGKAVSPG